MRYGLPSAFEEISHTADVGVRARGADLDEAYARAALAMAQLQAGGGLVEPREPRELRATGEDPASLLVDLCRQVLDLFFGERLLLGAIALRERTDTEIVADAWFDPFDADRHAEGVDLKAVTYAGAGVRPLSGGGFEASVIFDI
jgi:SHS2 domain-containing protein